MVSPDTLPPVAADLCSAPAGHTPEELGAAATAEESSAVQSEGGSLQMDVQLEHETVWLSQRGMAEVFATTPKNVLMHLCKVFATQELDAVATAKDSLVARTVGARQLRRRIRRYFPHTITSVGSRVDSQRAPQSAPDVPSAFRNARVQFTPRSRR